MVEAPIVKKLTLEDYLKLEGIFVPWAAKSRIEYYGRPPEGQHFGRFVHYTSADAGMKILRSKSLWMRNATCMADYSEVRHGHKYLVEFFGQDNRQQTFFDLVDLYHPGVAKAAFAALGGWWSNNLPRNTYITSVSEHKSEEDLHGRLSMWRAFGGGNAARVACVVKFPWSSNALPELGLMIGPVEYFTGEQVKIQLSNVLDNVKREGEFLKSLLPAEVESAIFRMLLENMFCLKHESFCEEKEWRIIHTPQLYPSKWMKREVEVVDGVPQPVYPIPLDSSGSDLLSDMELPRLFDRLIIGPTQFSEAMSDAFVAELEKAKVEDAATKVFRSGIPIRA